MALGDSTKTPQDVASSETRQRHIARRQVLRSDAQIHRSRQQFRSDNSFEATTARGSFMIKSIAVVGNCGRRGKIVICTASQSLCLKCQYTRSVHVTVEYRLQTTEDSRDVFLSAGWQSLLETRLCRSAPLTPYVAAFIVSTSLTALPILDGCTLHRAQTCRHTLAISFSNAVSEAESALHWSRRLFG